jgi:hypothetical protein
MATKPRIPILRKTKQLKLGRQQTILLHADYAHGGVKRLPTAEPLPAKEQTLADLLATILSQRLNDWKFSFFAALRLIADSEDTGWEGFLGRLESQLNAVVPRRASGSVATCHPILNLIGRRVEILIVLAKTLDEAQARAQSASGNQGSRKGKVAKGSKRHGEQVSGSLDKLFAQLPEAADARRLAVEDLWKTFHERIALEVAMQIKRFFQQRIVDGKVIGTPEEVKASAAEVRHWLQDYRLSLVNRVTGQRCTVIGSAHGGYPRYLLQQNDAGQRMVSAKEEVLPTLLEPQCVPSLNNRERLLGFGRAE